MVSKKIVVGLVALMFAASGCATWSPPSGGMTSGQGMCMVVGGLLGGGAGAVIGHQSHDDENDKRARAGGGIGLIVGAVAGNLICSGFGPDTPKLPPSMRISANPSSGTAPLSTELRAVGDSDIVSYAWDLGDGTTATGARVSHVYGSPGRYTATVTGTDSDGMTGSASAVISAAEKAMPPPPMTAKKIVLRGVNFDFDKATIRSDAEVILDAAVEVLKENSGVQVQVGGYTDATGPEAYNQGLSERRADAVRSYLVSNGVSAGSLTTAGYGESNPVASNDTRDGRAQNRRVELNVQQ